jgi:hypothetical protein
MTTQFVLLPLMAPPPALECHPVTVVTANQETSEALPYFFPTRGGSDRKSNATRK